MSANLNFNVIARDEWSKARAGVMTTAHGVVETPIFMPVATHAALRGVDVGVTEALDYQVLLANTYHLLLRPGPQVFKRVGGIHTFMQWPRAVLTDSGGFQIFSLSRQLRMTEEGARFRSYVDGQEIVLTPELSIETQRAIGSDIMMVLDQCINATSGREATRQALELTTRWAKRSLVARGDSAQALFGIVQGACYPDLRRESAEQITALPFDGFALGGLAVGETKSEREDITEFAAPLLPEHKPRYLMGVGTPLDILEAVRRGVDMFDCILPTSLAHQGVCFTSRGRIDLRRGVYSAVDSPLDPQCTCSTCQRFTRAYLSHLVRAGEFIVGQLLSIHNLTFYRTLMREMRAALLTGSFRAFYEQQKDLLEARDVEFPSIPPRVKRSRPLLTLGDFQVVTHPSGAYGSIQQISSGETMHSVIEPLEEAKSLYVDQPALVARARALIDRALIDRPLVIWDVGLGAGTNAMAAIHALEASAEEFPLTRGVTIVSFELDLDPLRLALRHPGLFTHLRHQAPHRLLEHREWTSTRVPLTWTLLEGDFLSLYHTAEKPEVILYDPFSAKVDTPLWQHQAFAGLREFCDDGRPEGTALYTYTNSTAVRAALLAAGWYVGSGRGSGPKTETTVALTRAANTTPYAPALLTRTWLERWERSDARQPLGTTSQEYCDLVSAHPQFSGGPANLVRGCADKSPHS